MKLIKEDVENFKCSLCNKEIKGYGNNGQPLTSGKVCDQCNKEVIKARLSNLKESKRKKKEQGWFVKYNSGNPEQNQAIFNSNMTMNTVGEGEGLGEALEIPDNINDFIKTNCDHYLFYKNEKGEEPVIEFILAQAPKMSAKICYDMTKLNKLGANARRPLSAHLRDGIYELRTQLGNDLSRCLYFFIEGNNMVFTNGVIKKTQAVPDKEIELAMKRRNEFIKNERGD